MHRLAKLSLLALLVVGWTVAPLVSGHVPAACAAGTVHVAFVVDFAGAAGSPGGVEQTCVPVASGSNGSQALAARAQLLGTPQPRYNSSGLLCSIDGFPSSGCGDAVAGGYDYWGYYRRTSTGWVHASQGPATTPMTDGDVEGWRWEGPGKGTPADPPPNSSATASDICPPASPPATGAPATADPVTTVVSSFSSSTTRLSGGSPPPALPATVAPTSTTAVSSARTVPDSTTAAWSVAANSVPSLVTAPATHRNSSHSNPWPPIILAGVVIAGLGGGGLCRWKRPPRSESS